MQNTFSIAIDGPAGAGKSTIAKALASALDVMYLDTGAMYRAVGLYMTRAGVPLSDPKAIAAHVGEADVNVTYDHGAQRILLGDEDVSLAIREPEISLAASQVSAVAEVRERMVDLQRRIARGHSVVMDGRDIGTHVLPDATLKVYLTASAEVRAQRRCKELESKGMSEPYEKVLEEMLARDYQDMHREVSPLRPAEDARHVDSSYMTQDEVVNAIRALLDEALARRS